MTALRPPWLRGEPALHVVAWRRALTVARRGALVVALALALWPATARGETARVRLAYRAAEGCPDEATFVAAVTAQARPFQRAPRSAARVRSLDASVRRGDDGFSGLLRVREADGSTSERDVRGATCGEVFSALSLVAAITIDTGPPEPRPPPPEPPEPPGPPAPPRRWTIATAVLGGAFFSMAKDATLGVVPTLQVSTPAFGVPFGVQLGAVLASSPRTSTTAGSAEFLWAGARLAVSVSVLPLGPFSLHATAGVGAGAVRGRGLAIATPRVQVLPWFDLAAGARAELELVPRLGLDLAGGMLVPITRARWVFEDPDLLVHETPPVGAYVTFGLRAVLAP